MSSQRARADGGLQLQRQGLVVGLVHGMQYLIYNFPAFCLGVQLSHLREVQQKPRLRMHALGRQRHHTHT